MSFEKKFRLLDEKLKIQKASHKEGIEEIAYLFKQADEQLHIVACYSMVTIGLLVCGSYFLR